MSVYFKCKSCQNEHRSPAGFPDKISFDAATMQTSEFSCRDAGRTTSYSRSDMYWRDESGA